MNWIIWVDAFEMTRLQKLRDSPLHGVHGYPKELITPKPRPKTGGGPRVGAPELTNPHRRTLRK
jgi:hypothetical protein